MGSRNNDVILSSQLAAILSVTIIGVGILSLPRLVVDEVGADNWVLVIAGSGLALVFGLIMAFVGKKFPGRTYLELTQSLLGKPVGTLITLGFSLYLMILAAIEVRIFGEVTKQYLLFNTPLEALSVTILVLAVYLARSGIETIARMAEIIFPIATVIAVLLVLPVIPELDVSYILPLLRTPPMKFIKALPTVVFSYVGMEVVLLFSSFVKDTKKIHKSVILTIALVTWFYLSVTWLTVSRFGLIETAHILWPALELFKTVDLPGAFLENVEAFIMSIWIFSVFMTLAVAYFGSSLTLSQAIGSKEQNYLVLPLLPIIYFLAMIPDNVAQLRELLDLYSFYMGTLYIAVVPVALLIMSFLKKQKGGKKGA
ncbi:spore germination protein [Anaerosolibacter carboniphilus]|uniref:Spore germination protein n=1 Tax=Anaerosolibacter carboniphilus TaxID=1417629 RepID=A0A841KQ75_9FIRM|nr:endospore germination permease [Anaerosolibacter carboniphilus]MBB6215573.1 spore germination protein [Anaerosolibacter carboniphilus]